MIVRFEGKLNIDILAKKLMEIADSNIEKDQKGNYVWEQYEKSAKRQTKS
jgi:hypothetical protein